MNAWCLIFNGENVALLQKFKTCRVRSAGDQAQPPSTPPFRLIRLVHFSISQGQEFGRKMHEVHRWVS